MSACQAAGGRPRVVVGRRPGPRGHRALRYAVGLARMYRCPLFVVDVVGGRPSAVRLPVVPVDLERVATRRRAEVAEELDAAAGDALDGIDVRVAVVRGPVRTALDRLADRPGDRLVLAAGHCRLRPSTRRAATLVV